MTAAKLNKPVLSIAPGKSYNSGLSLFLASGIPSVTPRSRLAFNEVTFGFVPHAGASYFASRMQGELGTYYLLTGQEMSASDALALGLADKMINIP